MSDMLVKLYELPDAMPVIRKLRESGIIVKGAIAPERRTVTEWVEKTFGTGWAGECEAAFSNHPVSCFIAESEGKIVGFACYDATYRDFFGPTGVDPAFRGRGIGKGLLLACLHAMAALGYAYAVIGDAGPQEYYRLLVNAVEIEGSHPEIYADMLKST